MACHMNEYRELHLLSLCDQCGESARFRALHRTDEERLREVRREWNEHHEACSTADGIKAPRFPVPLDRDDLPMAEIAYV